MSDPLAAGIHALAVPGLADGFAAVLGAHRFLHNDRVTLPRLARAACTSWPATGAGSTPTTWGLVIHDWSALSYPGHARKADQAKLTNEEPRLRADHPAAGRGRARASRSPRWRSRLRGRPASTARRHAGPGAKAYRIDEVLPSMQAVAGPGAGRAAGPCHRPRGRRPGPVPRLAGGRPALPGPGQGRPQGALAGRRACRWPSWPGV